MTANEIGNLIDRHSGPLALYARQWVDSPEDIVQEAFLRLVKSPQPLDKAVPWLYRVVRNAAIDALKARQRRRLRERDHALSREWFVEAQVDGLDAETAVRCLESLPDEVREVIVAHVWGGLTFEQIAKLAGVSDSTAHRHYQTGIAELRSKLGGPCQTKTN